MLSEGYGLSEASPVTHTSPSLSVRKPGSIGIPLPDTDMKIVDLETGTTEVPLGQEGELCIAGPQVMKGYWNRPDETAIALRKDADGRAGSTPATSPRWTRTASPTSSSARRT